MATYLVFEPSNGLRTQETAERVVFLRERFSAWAFLLTPLWLLRYRLWLAFVLWLMAFVLITGVGGWLGFGPYAAGAASFFPSLLVALEATSLRARKLSRLGYRDAGVVLADNLEIAEQRFFDTWRNSAAAPERAPDALPKMPPRVFPKVLPDPVPAPASAPPSVPAPSAPVPSGPVKSDYPYPPSSVPPAQPQTKIASANESGVIGLFPNPGNRT